MSVVANVAINVDSRNAVTKLRQVQSQSQATERAVNGLGAAVGKLASAFGVIQAARFVFVKTAELESQTRSLQILSGSAEKAGQIIKELQQLGAVTPFTSTELIDSAKRLQAFGVETDKVVETTRRLADASGATGAELSGLVTAYGQVQAKGRLQGEELLQFQERGIGLQQELRKQYNLTGEEFQDALEDGQISAKAVEAALVSLTSVGGKYANGAIAQSDTLNGRLSTLQDGVDSLARGIGAALSPAIKAVLNEAIFAINVINNLIATGARAKGFGLGQQQRQQILQQAQSEAEDIVNRRRIRDPFERNRQFQELTTQRERDLIESYGFRTGQVKAPATAPQMATQAPPLLGGDGAGKKGRKGKSDADREAEKAAREAKRAAEQMQQQLKAADDINFALKNRLAIAQETESVAKRMVEFDIRQNEIAKEYDELKKAAKSADELALINANQIIEQRIAQIEYEQEINDLLAQRAILMADVVNKAAMPTVYNELETQDAALQAVLDKYPAIGAAADAAATMATSGIAAMIAGTQSAEQVFIDFLSSVADALINTAKQMIAQYIAIGIAKMFAGLDDGGGGGFAASGPLAAVGNVGTGFNFDAGAMIPAFAEGGFVTGPTNALIGEGGESEYVIPASKMQSAMSRYSRGARGEAVIPATGGSDGDATPATGGPATIDVRYSVERINNVEYVTADQFQAGIRQAAVQGATQGEQRTLRRLQQSASTRRRIGV